MNLIDANRLNSKQYKELIETLGGKYSFWQRIRMGGTAVGGLFLKADEHKSLNLRYNLAAETVKLSIEQLKRGILIGLSNTKKIKLIPYTHPIPPHDEKLMHNAA